MKVRYPIFLVCALVLVATFERPAWADEGKCSKILTWVSRLLWNEPSPTESVADESVLSEMNEQRKKNDDAKIATIALGDRVMLQGTLYSSNAEVSGTVHAISFSTAVDRWTVKIQVDNGNRFAEGTVGRTRRKVSSYGKFTVGDRIWARDAFVHEDSYAATDGRTGRVVSRQRTYSTSGKGTVLELFEEGFAIVQFDGKRRPRLIDVHGAYWLPR